MPDSALENAIAQVSDAQKGVPIIRAFFDKPTFTVSYVVHDPETKQAAIIDSVLDFDPASGRTSFASADAIIAYVAQQGLAVDWLLETHAHADHLSAAPYLQQKLGGKIAIGEHIVTVQNVFGKLFNAGTDFQRDGSDFDQLFADGDHFQIGKLDVTVLHVPGHTPADIAYVIGDAVFTGDTSSCPITARRARIFPAEMRGNCSSRCAGFCRCLPRRGSSCATTICLLVARNMHGKRLWRPSVKAISMPMTA